MRDCQICLIHRGNYNWHFLSPKLRRPIRTRQEQRSCQIACYCLCLTPCYFTPRYCFTLSPCMAPTSKLQDTNIVKQYGYLKLYYDPRISIIKINFIDLILQLAVYLGIWLCIKWWIRGILKYIAAIFVQLTIISHDLNWSNMNSIDAVYKVTIECF